MYCNQCQYFNQCSYKNQLVPVPYYRNSSWNCQDCCSYCMGHPQMQMPYTPYNSFMPYTVPIRQEDEDEFVTVEQYPPNLPEGAFAIIDLQFARRAVASCKAKGRRARLRVTLNSGEVLELTDYRAGQYSLYGTNVDTGGPEVLDYNIITRASCRVPRRVRNGDTYEYQYEECDCTKK